MPRILVLSASVGAGHVRAAQAVELALRQVLPGAVIKNQDVLELTNAAFRRIYGKAYLDLVNRAPHVLGYFYDLLDQPSRSGRQRGDRLRLAVEKLNLKSLVRLLRDEKWDLIINTHFLPAEILQRKKRGFAVNVVDDWFRSSFSQTMDGMLLDSSSLIYQFLHPEVVSRTLAAHQNGSADNHKILFSLVALEQSLRGVQA